MRRWRVPLAGGAAGLLLLGAYFIGFHRPRSAEIERLNAESDQLLSERVPLQREVKGLEEVADRKAEFDTALQVLERLIPAGLAQPTLLAQLQAAADAAGVRLVSVSFAEPAAPEGAPASSVPGTVLVAMPLTAIVEGPYAAVSEMLRRVEDDVERAVLVGTVALTEAADPGFPQLTATWSGQAYALLAPDDPLLAKAGSQAEPAEPAPPGPPAGSGG